MIEDKVCIITGATSGIGKATAEALAEKGARIVLIGRNFDKGKAVLKEIQEKTKNPNLDLLIADLSSQSAIRKVAAEFLAKYEYLHVLINNAGIATRKRTLSADGIEMTFAVNHLAYFLLTNLLLDRIKASAPARIINVSSEGHRNAGRLDFDNLQGEKKYGAFRAYSITKLCNILFTYELARRLEGTPVTANAMHPGYLYTSIFREASAPARFLVKLTAGRPDKGAQAVLHLATSSELEGVTGKYFKGTREAPSSFASYDRDAAEKLWQISSRLTGNQIPTKPTDKQLGR